MTLTCEGKNNSGWPCEEGYETHTEKHFPLKTSELSEIFENVVIVQSESRLLFLLHLVETGNLKFSTERSGEKSKYFHLETTTSSAVLSRALLFSV